MTARSVLMCVSAIPARRSNLMVTSSRSMPRMLKPIDNIQPAELEQAYYRLLGELAMAA